MAFKQYLRCSLNQSKKKLEPKAPAVSKDNGVDAELYWVCLKNDLTEE